MRASPRQVDITPLLKEFDREESGDGEDEDPGDNDAEED